MFQICMGNRYFTRILTDGETGFKTVVFTDAAGTELIRRDESCEGKVVFDDKTYLLGGKKENSLPYRNHEWIFVRGGKVKRLSVTFGASGNLPRDLQVRLIYDIPEDIPVLIKHLRIENESDVAVKLEEMELERFTPVDNKKSTLVLESDYVADAIKIDGRRAYFPWIEHHAVYIDKLLKVKEKETVFAYPVKISRWILENERFCSFKAFEFILPNDNLERRGLFFRDATRKLFPWSANTYLGICVSPKNGLCNYYNAIDRAAEVGLDLVELRHVIDRKMKSPLFTNFSDYELNRDLFPEGWKDVRKLTDYAHAKNILIGFYTIYVNTWQGTYEKGPRALIDNNWELQWADDHYEKHSMPDADGLRWGMALDPATDWGLFINRKMEEVVRKGNFDMYLLDGPYYGDVSVAECFRGLPPGGPNQVVGWNRQAAFYQIMRAMGVLGEAAQGFHALAHGVGRITTTGYEEGDFSQKTMYDQILSNRKAAYDFTYAYRSEQAVTYVPVCKAVENCPTSQCMEPMEENCLVYNAYLANCYGYGFEGKLHCNVPFDGPKSKAVLERWLNFWHSHEEFFKKGFLLHLARPDGENLDAVAHVIMDSAHPRAVVVVYNPTENERSGKVSLRAFANVDFPTENWLVKSEAGRKSKTEDGFLLVKVSPRNATWYDLEK